MKRYYIAPVKQIRAAMLTLSRKATISIDDIVRELQRTNSFQDTPRLREEIQKQCDLAWSIEAHARRIAAGTEKPFTLAEMKAAASRDKRRNARK
jgi:hypothetical protein